MSQINVIDKGKNNSVSLPGKWKILRNSQINISGNNNTVSIGQDCRFDGLSIVIRGDNNHLTIGNEVLGTGTFTLSGNGTLTIGDFTTIGRCSMTAYKGVIDIGADCMFAQGLEIRTTDSHPVFDLKTRKRINGERDVVIEDYVWCGARVTFMKGSKVSKSSVVALGSIVTKQFNKPFSLIGGYPAKILRSNVTWTRRTHKEILEDDPVAMHYIEDWFDEDGSNVHPLEPIARKAADRFEDHLTKLSIAKD